MRIAVQANPSTLAPNRRPSRRAFRGRAVVTFTGIVRGDGGLSAMEIEHYPA